MQSASELAASLRDYREQLSQVQDLLAHDPGNAEYLDLQASLQEVAALTEDVLQGAEVSPLPPPTGFSAPLFGLRTNWAPGEPCQALFNDGVWHAATVQASASGGGFRVLFEHYAVPVTLPPSSLRASLRSAADEVYVGVPAPRRVLVDDSVPKEIPKKLEIRDTDDERTRERKKKLLKALKSKQRLKAADEQQTERAQSWQAFRTGKVGKHKTGFLTRVDDKSMFSTPEGGRVGVTGSGKAPTLAAEKRKHEFGGPGEEDQS